jgi:hypothetical protein
LPCKKCGTTRVFWQDQLVCPNCDGIPLRDTGKVLAELKVELQSYLKSLQLLIDNADYGNSLLMAAGLREEAARLLLEDPTDEDHARNWVALSILMRFLRPGLKSPTVTFRELYGLSYEIQQISDKIAAIEMGNLVASRDGLIATETEPILKCPKSVTRYLDSTLGPESTRTGDSGGERAMFLHMMIDARALIVSETLSRTMQNCFHIRLLPALGVTYSPEEFRDVSVDVATWASLILGKDFRKGSGLLVAPKEVFDFVYASVKRSHGERVTNAFFAGVGDEGTTLSSLEGLGHTCITRDRIRGYYLVPYHSLLLLATASYKHAKNRETGLASNVKGKPMEEVIFATITGIVDTTHPKSGKKLLSFVLPEGGGDLDAGGIANGSLVIVESKSWDAPTVSALERELEKFEKTLNYVERHKEVLGFDGLSIVPMFFTPFPPYPRFNAITLVPTVLSLTLLLAKRFGVRRFELTEGSKAAQEFFESDRDERLLALDVSETLTDLPSNTYRIQEGIVSEIDDDEVTVHVCLITGDVLPFYFDINESIRNRLRDSSVVPGTLIRMLLLNLTGTWANVQLVDFKVVRPSGDKAKANPESVLKELNPKSSDQLFIAQTWGGQESADVVNFAEKWHINVRKLVDRMKVKGMNPLTGMSAVLEFESPDATILQCDCGNVFRVPTKFLQRTSGAKEVDRLRCPDCDPSIAKSLEQAGYHDIMPIDSSALLRLVIELQGKNGFPP